MICRAPPRNPLARTLTSSTSKPALRSRRVKSRSGPDDHTASMPPGHSVARRRANPRGHIARQARFGAVFRWAIFAQIAGGRMKDVVVIGAGKIGATVAGLLASTGDYQVILAD